MSNQTIRNESYMQELADFIRKNYNLKVTSLIPAKRGFYGETWCLVSEEKSYFVKLVYFVEYQPIYQRSFEVIDFLCRNGIDFISSIVRTADGHLWTDFDGAVLGVFNWIDGENVETDETKAPEYRMLAKIYSIPLDGCRIAREDFAGENAAMFFRQWKLIRDQEITSLLEHNRRKLEYRAEKLRYFADLCRKDTRHFYLTHGDAGGNFLVSRDKCFLVDWDGVLLAPPERDAWVMGFREWARNLFCESLLRNGIEYSLRPERLAYYCYDMFFFWLTWLIRCSKVNEIEDFFRNYGDERIEYADELWKQSQRSILS